MDYSAAGSRPPARGNQRNKGRDRAQASRFRGVLPVRCRLHRQLAGHPRPWRSTHFQIRWPANAAPDTAPGNPADALNYRGHERQRLNAGISLQRISKRIYPAGSPVATMASFNTGQLCPHEGPRPKPSPRQ